MPESSTWARLALIQHQFIEPLCVLPMWLSIALLDIFFGGRVNCKGESCRVGGLCFVANTLWHLSKEFKDGFGVLTSLPCMYRHAPGIQPFPEGLLCWQGKRKQCWGLPKPGRGGSPSWVSRGILVVNPKGPLGTWSGPWPRPGCMAEDSGVWSRGRIWGSKTTGWALLGSVPCSGAQKPTSPPLTTPPRN